MAPLDSLQPKQCSSMLSSSKSLGLTVAGTSRVWRVGVGKGSEENNADVLDHAVHTLEKARPSSDS